ncbi:MAG: hypothetical protein PHS68_04450 [Candidatus Izemoplasmatales bacterium]|nr:hypothetical protein [Candidatus Izemoplasmatales bacterium]
MARMKDFLEKQKQKSRLEFLRSWMSSFAVTISVVVIMVVVVPKSPVATLTRVEAYANEVFYQVEVTDQDNAILPGTLKAVLENQLEQVETSLDCGSTTASFANLKANTMYQIAIMADKGFGLEKLASTQFKTESRVGGAIRSHTLISSTEEWELEYDIGLFIHDPESEFQEIRLLYGVIYPSETEPVVMESLVINAVDTQVILAQIPNYNVGVKLILEGSRWDNEVVILDELTFYTPFHLETSFDLSRIDAKSLACYFYPDSSSGSDSQYQIVLKRSERIIQTREVEVVALEQTHSDSQTIEFTGLTPDTDYTLELTASYTNPQTLIKQNILLSILSVHTLPDFTYRVSIIETLTIYEVTITLNDPAHNFQQGFYLVSAIEEEYEYTLASGESGFTPSGAEKTVVFVISKPDILNYQIHIGVRSDTIYTNQSILETIKP